jgi:hypothetical protein
VVVVGWLLLLPPGDTTTASGSTRCPVTHAATGWQQRWAVGGRTMRTMEEDAKVVPLMECPVSQQ